MMQLLSSSNSLVSQNKEHLERVQIKPMLAAILSQFSPELCIYFSYLF